MNIFREKLPYITISVLAIVFLISLLPFHVDRKYLVLISVLLFGFAYLLCYLIERKINSVLSNTINFLNQLSKQDFDNRITLDSFYLRPDLARSLNELSDKLRIVFSSLRKEKNELQAILSAMNEGVILIAGTGAITLINRSAKAMFQIEQERTDKPYWEIIRNKDLKEIIAKVLETKKPDTREISLLYPEERFYRVNAINIDDASADIIVVLFDITEFKKLEKIKADFIANVSHELRTPLTSIKGYVETLEDRAYSNEEERMQFLEIINKNADRLINIVSDLLVLSELESKESFYSQPTGRDFELINIGEIVNQSVLSLKGKMAENKLEYSLDIEENLPAFSGNKFLLEEMVSNLVDNAIKYTPSNGNISVHTYKTGSEIIVEVSDTGIGIPKEDQDRIFERFYRVDKTRSRKVGGTGLGLSIVKHIVLLHGGSVEVESELNKGSKFIVKLPYRSAAER